MATGYFITGSSDSTIELLPLSTSGSATGGARVSLISGAPTDLSEPLGCIINGNNLWVADSVGVSGSGSIFKWATSALGVTGSPVPSIIIDGLLTTFSGPADVAIGTDGKIYVANEFNDDILIFAAAANGNVAPIASISGNLTTLSSPQGIAVDSHNNVYVVQFGIAKILKWNAGNTGNVAPDVVITGALTSLDTDGPNTVRIDTNDNIWVGQPDGSILKFAAGSSGNVTPIQVIAGTPCAYTVTTDVLQVGSVAVTSATINMPASILAGDILVMQFACNQHVLNFTGPAGWTTTFGNNGGAYATRVANGSEAASYTWTWTSPSASWLAHVTKVRPTKTCSVAIHNSNSNSTGTNLTALGVFAGVKSGSIGDLRICLYNTIGPETITLPVALTSMYSDTGVTIASLAAGFQVLAANPVDQVATIGANDGWGTDNIIVHPTGGIDPTGISFDVTGNIYVTDDNFNQGLKFAAAASGNAAPLNTITDLSLGAWGNAQGASAPPPPSVGCVNFEIQTPSVLVNEGQLAVLQRTFIDIDCGGQTVTPVILVDGSDFTQATITGSGRQTFEIAFQKSGRLIGLRLTGCASGGRVEFFGAESDIYVGEP